MSQTLTHIRITEAYDASEFYPQYLLPLRRNGTDGDVHLSGTIRYESTVECRDIPIVACQFPL